MVAGSIPAGRAIRDARVRTAGGLIDCLDDGGRSSDGRAPDCDSGRRGFESHRSPIFSAQVSSS